MLQPAPVLDWHALDANEVASRLETDIAAGLSPAEAGARLSGYGPNEISSAMSRSLMMLVLRQFTSALVLILLLAAGLSLLVGEVIDAVAILVIIAFNAVLGVIQEWQAQNAIEGLHKMLAPVCEVVRGGKQQHISSAGLVPGDIVLLSAGDRVPADLRLVDTSDLRADESALTGESIAVAKQVAPVVAGAALYERASVLSSGTLISSGHCRGIVVATGRSSELGRIAELTARADPGATPLQRKITRLAAQLGVGAIAAAIFVGAMGWSSGWPLAQSLMAGISVAVAMVPEGLPAAITVTLALGARALARRKALLRVLQAAETLGATTTICTDKTGTLTRNDMVARHMWIPSADVIVETEDKLGPARFILDGQTVRALDQLGLQAMLHSAAACNNARLDGEADAPAFKGQPTETALLALARQAGLDVTARSARCFEAAFTSERKRMSVVLVSEPRLLHTKGASEMVLPLCSSILVDGRSEALSEDHRREVVAAADRLSQEGLRIIAVARRHLSEEASLSAEDAERELEFLGLVGLYDPPRPETRAAIASTRTAGIKVIMITGDSAETARAIASQIGLPEARALEGKTMAGMSDRELSRLLADGAVFARTSPEDKIRIVSLLQSGGEVVAMTGDGANDAPALNQADIGIAMGLRGTDAARDASDLVLADDNFATIVTAIEQGRRQRDNIRKFVRYLLASNLGELVAIIANLLIGGPLILLPIQILWMNLVTDGPTALALSTDAAGRDVMQRPPEPRETPLIDLSALTHMLAVALTIGAAAVAAFHWRLMMDPAAEAEARTLALTTIVVVQKVNVFSFRALSQPIWSLAPWSNKWLLVALTGTLLFQFAAIYSPFLQTFLHTAALSGEDWLVIAIASVALLAMSELSKSILGIRRPNAVKTV